MGFLGITILISLVLIWEMIIYYSIQRAFKSLHNNRKEKLEEPKVTDPFQKPKEIYSSTSHIVVPKTPTEIRNQNFKKIKEGVEYGDIRRD